MRMVNKDINNILNNQNIKNINFCLYFKKFIELDEKEKFKKFNDVAENLKKGIPKVDGHEVRLKNLYSRIDDKTINEKLTLKNKILDEYILTLEQKYNYKKFEKVFKLKSRMIVGIGETTAGEVGMIFDYNIGVPYIPASSIKGVVRYKYFENFILKLLKNEELKKKVPIKKENIENEMIEENAEGTLIYLLFGGEKKTLKTDKDDWNLDGTYMGSIVFLDSYPIVKPKLDIDIINVHYQDYYKDGSKAPKDNMEPKIIKFLTVASGTEFKFRYAIDLNKLNDKNKIKEFEEDFIKTLTEHGIGAKTNLGYGIFDIPN